MAPFPRIDSRLFEADPDRHATVADLRRIAGWNPSGYDLAEVRGRREIHRLADSEPAMLCPTRCGGEAAGPHGRRQRR